MSRTGTAVLFFLCAVATPAYGARPGSRAFVIDSTVAVLRVRPSLDAAITKRLSDGRRVVILSQLRDRDGTQWTRVAVTRRTRGWVLAIALASPGDRGDERRMLDLLDDAEGIHRLRVARTATDHFPAVRAQATAVFNDEADRAALELSARLQARHELPSARSDPMAIRAHLLSDPMLDRYLRLGLSFDVDVASLTYTARRGRR